MYVVFVNILIFVLIFKFCKGEMWWDLFFFLNLIFYCKIWFKVEFLGGFFVVIKKLFLFEIVLKVYNI